MDTRYWVQVGVPGVSDQAVEPPCQAVLILGGSVCSEVLARWMMRKFHASFGVDKGLQPCPKNCCQGEAIKGQNDQESKNSIYYTNIPFKAGLQLNLP